MRYYRYHNRKWNIGDISTSTLSSYLSFIALLPFYIDGLIPQINISAFGDYIFDIPTVGRVLILIIVMIFNFRLISYKESSSVPFAIYAFLLYISILLLPIILMYGLRYAIQGFTMYYSYALIIPLFFVKFIRSNAKLEYLLITISVFLCILGISQFILNDPIVATDSSNQRFSVTSWRFFSENGIHVRAFSLFSSALQFGILLIFVSGIVIHKLHAKFKLTWLLLILLLIFTVYCTLTRNVYLGMVISILASFFYLKLNSKLLLLIPLVSILLGGYIANRGTGSNDSSGVTSSASLNMRTKAWREIAENIYTGDAIPVLFGSGKYQTNDIKKSSLLIDNTYLAIIIQYGIVGLIFIAYIYITVYHYILSLPRRPITCGFFGLLSALPCMAVFNIFITELAIYFIITLFIYKTRPNNHGS